MICKKCKQDLEEESFYKDKHKKSGRDSSCKSCRNLKLKAWRDSNKDLRKAILKRYREKNKVKLKLVDTLRREDVNRYSKDYRLRHPDRHCARQSLRRANKIKATPPWLTADQKKEIADFYWLAKDLEKVSCEKYHVDHIVPLNGEDVCGLHVPWNLQILPSDLNLSKGNR